MAVVGFAISRFRIIRPSSPSLDLTPLAPAASTPASLFPPPNHPRYPHLPPSTLSIPSSPLHSTSLLLLSIRLPAPSCIHTHTRTPTLHLHSDPPPIVSARPPPKPTPAQPRSQSRSLPESTTPYPPSNGRILLVKNSPLPPYTSALHNSLVHPTSARR